MCLYLYLYLCKICIVAAVWGSAADTHFNKIACICIWICICVQYVLYLCVCVCTICTVGAVWGSAADTHFNIVAPRPLICPHIHAKNPPSYLDHDEDDDDEDEDDDDDNLSTTFS